MGCGYWLSGVGVCVEEIRYTMASVRFNEVKVITDYTNRGTTPIYGDSETDFKLNIPTDPRAFSHDVRMRQNLQENLLRIDPKPVYSYQIRGELIYPHGKDPKKYNSLLQAWKSRRNVRESAQRFAIDFYNANKENFLGGRNNLQALTENAYKTLPKALEKFKAKYSDEDLTQIKQGIKAATDSLHFTANLSTPAAKGKLFGFIPIKVDQSVQQFIAVTLAAITAGIGTYLSGASQAGAVGGAEAGTVAGSTIEAGAFSANLGIRGVQAANLASAGGYPGAALGFSSPTLSGGSFAIAAAPLSAVTPQALRLGVTGTTIQPTYIDTVTTQVTNSVNKVKDWIYDNPVQAAVGATGASMTLKKVAESSNPLAALVNTVAGAVGLPPIIQPPSPSPGSIPASFFSGGSGGGGGQGFGVGTTNIVSTGLLWILLIGGLILLVLKLRK